MTKMTKAELAVARRRAVENHMTKYPRRTMYGSPETWAKVDRLKSGRTMQQVFSEAIALWIASQR